MVTGWSGSEDMTVRNVWESCLVGEEWCDRVSGLTITALGLAGDGSSIGSRLDQLEDKKKMNIVSFIRFVQHLFWIALTGARFLSTLISNLNKYQGTLWMGTGGDIDGLEVNQKLRNSWHLNDLYISAESRTHKKIFLERRIF